MQSHADTPTPSKFEPTASVSRPPVSLAKGRKSVAADSRPAVRKGFLDGGSGGSLYGEEGSREGGGGGGNGVSGNGRRTSKKDNEIDKTFDRLVAEADSDMEKVK